MKKQLIILSVTLLTLSLHAKKEKTKTVTKLPGTMLIGDSIKLKGHSHLKSSKTDVIEVSGDKGNVLTAHKAGKATISEKVGKKDKQRGTIEVTKPGALRTIAHGTGEVVEGGSKVIVAPFTAFFSGGSDKKTTDDQENSN